MARILCISDLHFINPKKNTLKGDLEDKTSINMFNLLKSTLVNTFANKNKIDIMIFCGDYIYGPENSVDKNKSFCNFLNFLDSISSNEMGLFNSDDPSSHIFIIPGNHDVIRRDDSEDILKNFKNNTSNYLTPFNKSGPIYIFEDLKLIIAAESTVNNSNSTDVEVEEFISELEHIKFQNNVIKEKLLKFLNTHLRYDIPTIEADTKSKFIDINNKLKSELVDYNNYLKIVVTHHPLLSGVEKSITIKEYDKTIGGYDFMRKAINFGYQLFIHGHLHEHSCLNIQDYSDKVFNYPVMQLGIPQLKGESENNGVILIETNMNQGFDISHLEINELDCKLNRIRDIYHKNSNVNNYHKNISYDHILVDYEIEKIINDGEIITKGNLDNVEAASYDCALGYEYKRQIIKDSYKWAEETLQIQKEGKPATISLAPNETVLIYTREKFNLPDNILMHASPISSWLRKGLNVKLSYFVDPGFKGNFCIPVTNNNSENIEIMADEPILSVELVELSRNCEKNWEQRHHDRVKIRCKYKDN